MTEEVVSNMMALIKEIESEEPIDFADLPFDDDVLRDFVLRTLLAQFGQMQKDGLDAQTINTVYLATTAKLVLENVVLHMRLRLAQGVSPGDAVPDVKALLGRYMRKSAPG
jgi:hypothetical protein